VFGTVQKNPSHSVGRTVRTVPQVLLAFGERWAWDAGVS